MRQRLRQALVDQPVQTVRAMVGERYWSALGRSFWDATDAVGQKVRVVIPATLIAAFLPIWALGLKWDRAALAALVAAALAYPAMFVCAFVETLVNNVRHPDEHKEWSIEPALVLGENIRFGIRSKIGSPYLEGHACTVKHPNGNTYRASTDIPGNGFLFYFWYDRDFGEEAAPPVTGRYEIAWFLPRGPKKKLRRALGYSEGITV
jgi:hypothetical protein